MAASAIQIVRIILNASAGMERVLRQDATPMPVTPVPGAATATMDLALTVLSLALV